MTGSEEELSQHFVSLFAEGREREVQCDHPRDGRYVSAEHHQVARLSAGHTVYLSY